MAFGDMQRVKMSRDLREINFGVHEGLHFDNLPEDQKANFSRPDFQAEGGESWPDVR